MKGQINPQLLADSSSPIWVALGHVQTDVELLHRICSLVEKINNRAEHNPDWCK
jgi:hypothetical protein